VQTPAQFQPSSDEQASGARNLLVIDDEPEILAALRRQFRKHYTIYVADSAEAGLQIMTQVPIQVIISDQRMPGMKGSEFFRTVRHEYPDAVRLLLTGYSDIQAIIDAINDGNVYRYISKPWNPVELDAIVREAFEHHDLIVANRRLVDQLTALNRELEQRIAERTQELLAMNEQKDRILGAVAHDLRGPLSGIHLSAEILRTDDLSAESRALFINTIYEAASKALRLVDDLLDVSAIASGNVTLSPERVDLAAFLEQVRQMNEFIGARKGIALQIERRDVALWRFDPRRIEQVLSNLIDNAFKFSHPQTTVTVSVFEQDDALVITVVDQGQGIRPEDMSKLFQMFEQTATRPTGSEPSTGLGLSICKRLVELHGGTISAESEVGKGSRFTIRLPRLD
jgi:signal transduction histidine kinase